MTVFATFPVPTWSGLALSYLYHLRSGAKLEVGLQQYSFLPGAALSIGLKL